MTVILSRHVTEKLVKELSRLGVTEELLREAVNKPDEILYDSATGRYVALKTRRNLAIVYERRGNDIFISTRYGDGKVVSMEILDASRKGLLNVLVELAKARKEGSSSCSQK